MKRTMTLMICGIVALFSLTLVTLPAVADCGNCGSASFKTACSDCSSAQAKAACGSCSGKTHEINCPANGCSSCASRKFKGYDRVHKNLGKKYKKYRGHVGPCDGSCRSKEYWKKCQGKCDAHVCKPSKKYWCAVCANKSYNRAWCQECAVGKKKACGPGCTKPCCSSASGGYEWNAVIKARPHSHHAHSHHVHNHHSHHLPLLTFYSWVMYDRNAVILDARSGKFLDNRRIPGAKALAPGASAAQVKRLIPTKETPVVTYCASTTCPASAKLAHQLREMGYNKVYEYPGGIKGWVDAGYPVEYAEWKMENR